MMTINDSHLKAVARAIHFVRSGITKNMSTNLSAAIIHDIALLDEVHKFCRQQIKEPGLPMAVKPKGTGNNGELDGPVDKTPAD